MSSRKGYEEDRQNISSAMFLAAPYDKASEAWTATTPNLSVSSLNYTFKKHMPSFIFFMS